MRPRLGVCYYPEHWPEHLWESDAARMAETGLSIVRIGEFAWSRLEPRRGDLRFDWLLRAMDTLGRHGLKVVVGTPTATPPKWLVDAMPDMLAVDESGRPRRFGSRRHYDFSHAGYREQCRRVVTLLAEAVGEHPALSGWQTDNEFGCHNTTYSYSGAALAGFRLWLAARYGEVGALNSAWGNVFWSMEYSSFNEVDLPNGTVTEANPAHRLDFRRYCSEQVDQFNAEQVAILKARRPDLPVVHNFMGRFTEFDHFAVAQTLDIAGWDSYPLGFLDQSSDSETKARHFRQGDPDFQAFHHDLYRAVGRGRFWVSEQQPGPVNWAPYNPDPLPGMVRLWSWEAAAHGAEAICYFRWRQAPFGQEQMHAGLLRPDSAPAPGLAEAAQSARELAATGLDGEPKRGRVGIVFDYESEWAWQIQPQAHGFSYFDLVLDFYAAFRKHGADIEILPPAARSFAGFDIVAIPGLFAWTPHLREAIASFEGHLLIGPRSGSKTEGFSIPPGLPPDLPDGFIDIKVIRVDTLRPPTGIAVKGGGAVLLWRERLEGGAEIVVEDEEDWPILVRSGKRFYLGAVGDRALVQRVADLLLGEADFPLIALPAGVRCRVRGGLRIYVNYGAGTANLKPAADEDGYVLGDAEMPPAGVTIARLATGGHDR